MISNTIICQLIFLFCASIAVADSESYVYGVTPTIDTCVFGMQKKMKRSEGSGFDIRVFQYDSGNTELSYDEDFMASGYTNETPKYSLTGVTDISFSGVIPDSDSSAPYEATFFGETLQVSNFVAEFTTYIGVMESGFFKFESDNTDDSMMFFIGRDSALQCCNTASTSDFSIVNSSSYNMFTANNNASSQSYYQYLEAGYHYPIRIVYANMGSNYSMSFKVTYPDSTVQTEFDYGYFYSPNYLKNYWGCYDTKFISADYKTVITSWTGSTPSYSIYTPTAGTNVYTAYNYLPDPTTTVTAYYHGSTVSSTMVTPTGAGTWIESIFYPAETETSYVPWTGATTVTSTTIIPEDAEIPATVVIKFPDVITTTTIPWTGAGTSGTTIYPADGQNGTITVEILTPRKTNTSYVPWTGAETEISTTILPENLEIPATVLIEIPDAVTATTLLWTGTETSTRTIYPVNDQNSSIIVQVLTPRDTKTVTDFWSGTTTSYTTEYPSELNNEVIVYQYVPQSVTSNGIVYITTYWTGDSTSYSTVNPGYNNDTITVLVDIPQETITETWSGTAISTSFYCPYNGGASVPVLLVPSSTALPKTCEDCGSSLVSISSSTAVGKSTQFYASYITAGSLSSSSSSNKYSGLSSSIPAEFEYSNVSNKIVLLNLAFAVSLSFTIYFLT